MRSDLEVELYQLDSKPIWYRTVYQDELDEKTLDDIGIDKDYTKFRIGQVNEELRKRNIPDKWMSV